MPAPHRFAFLHARRDVHLQCFRLDLIRAPHYSANCAADYVITSPVASQPNRAPCGPSRTSRPEMVVQLRKNASPVGLKISSRYTLLSRRVRGAVRIGSVERISKLIGVNAG